MDSDGRVNDTLCGVFVKLSHLCIVCLNDLCRILEIGTLKVWNRKLAKKRFTLRMRVEARLSECTGWMRTRTRTKIRVRRFLSLLSTFFLRETWLRIGDCGVAGKVFLFGRVQVSEGVSESCCIVANNIPRQVFIVPRETVYLAFWTCSFYV